MCVAVCVGEYVFKFVLRCGSDMGAACVPMSMSVSELMCAGVCASVCPCLAVWPLCPFLSEGLGASGKTCWAASVRLSWAGRGLQRVGAAVDFLRVIRTRSVRPNLSFCLSLACS